MENPIKMDDLGVPLFLETPIHFLGLCGRDDTSQHPVLVKLRFVAAKSIIFQLKGRLKLCATSWESVQSWTYPIPSMYGIFTYI